MTRQVVNRWNERMNEQNEHMHDWWIKDWLKEEWTNETSREWIKEDMNEMNKWINWINEWLNECTNEWMNGWMDAWMNERMNEMIGMKLHACMQEARKREGGREAGREADGMNEWTNGMGRSTIEWKAIEPCRFFFSVKFGDALQRTWTGHLTCPKVAPEKSSQEGSCHLAMDALKSNWCVTIECNRPTSPARYEHLWSRFWSLRSHMFPWFGMAPVNRWKTNKQKTEKRPWCHDFPHSKFDVAEPPCR